MESILYIALFIPIFPAIVATFKWKLLIGYQRLFTVMLWIIILISLCGELWSIITRKSNLPFFHLYILIEYIFLVNILKHILQKEIKKSVWQILLIGFSVIWIFNISIGNGWWNFPDYIHALEAFIIIILIVIWFKKILREKTLANPEKTFEFWICAALLFFFSGNFLLFIFSEFLMTIDMVAYKAIWKVHLALNILLYLMYSIALLWVKKTIK